MYYRLLEPLLDTGMIAGMAHITGGGITDNLPRILPEGTDAVIRKESWPVLPVFTFMQAKGAIEEGEMYRTFNMGIGMVLAVAQEHAEEVRDRFASQGESCYEIGAITEGERKVRYR
jgi:phosphoribosylformylglycinamidine cyclo-ligase